MNLQLKYFLEKSILFFAADENVGGASLGTVGGASLGTVGGASLGTAGGTEDGDLLTGLSLEEASLETAR
jgi:hypothetical protein